MGSTLDALLAELHAGQQYLVGTNAKRGDPDLIRSYGAMYADALRRVCSIINGNLSLHCGGTHRVKPALYDSQAFDARAWAPGDVDGVNVSDITLSLGILPPTIGLANAFAIAEATGPGKGSKHFIEQWHPRANPLGRYLGGPFEPATRELVVDALMLAFLHELSHVLQGHLIYQPSQSLSPDEERALETDADYGSGYYFSNLFLDFRQETASISSVHRGYALRRLSRAAFLLTNLFRALAARTSTYHLPETRLYPILHGAFEALNVEEKVERDRWMEQIEASLFVMRACLAEAQFRPFFVWRESDQQDDWDALHTITYPILRTLRFGPLLACRIDRKQQENA